MKKIANRVKVSVATPGQVTVTFGSPTSNGFYSPAEAGLVDGDQVAYVLVEGADVEQGFGTIGGVVTTMTRDTVRKSKIAGVAGNTKLTLGGAATLFIGPSAEDFTFHETHGADIASAGTLDLETSTGELIDVTGTTAITAITLIEGHERTVRFTGALVLTHGASLVLPGAANITTAAGAFAVFRGYAAGVVRCVVYIPVDGRPVVAAMSAAELAVPNTWTGVQGYALAPLTFAAAQTWDVSANPVAALTFTANITSFAVSGVVAGRIYLLKNIQDTSVRTAAYTAANFKFIGAAAPTLSVGSGAVDYHIFIGVSSTLLHEIGRAQNVG